MVWAAVGPQMTSPWASFTHATNTKLMDFTEHRGRLRIGCGVRGAHLEEETKNRSQTTNQRTNKVGLDGGLSHGAGLEIPWSNFSPFLSSTVECATHTTEDLKDS